MTSLLFEESPTVTAVKPENVVELLNSKLKTTPIPFP